MNKILREGKMKSQSAQLKPEKPEKIEEYQKQKKKHSEQKIVTNMADINITTSLITLGVNDLYTN